MAQATSISAEIPPPSAGRLSMQLAAIRMLWWREITRFVRQRNRVIGALGTPVVFWLLLGSGLNHAFQITGESAAAAGDGDGYLNYFFPGTLILIILFTAIFSTISVIEDRRSGFLQSVIIAPLPRLALVMGHVLGGATLAMLQAVIFLALWPLLSDQWHLAGLLTAGAVMVLISLGLTALGLCVAWPMQSTAAFHAIMNLFLMPLWFLSGSVFPLASASGWLKPIMAINPLTYAHQLLAGALIPQSAPQVVATPIAWAIVLISLLAILLLAASVVQRKQ